MKPAVTISTAFGSSGPAPCFTKKMTDFVIILKFKISSSTSMDSYACSFRKINIHTCFQTKKIPFHPGCLEMSPD